MTVSIIHMRGGICQNDPDGVFIIDWDEVNDKEAGLEYGVEAIQELLDLFDKDQVNWKECKESIDYLIEAIILRNTK